MKTIKNFLGFYADLSLLVMGSFFALYIWASRKIIKRYFNYETWGYKAWHMRHVKKMQAALDNNHMEWYLGVAF